MAIFLRPLIALFVVLLPGPTGTWGSEEREEVLPTVEEILEKARKVNEHYPWILLNDRGLTLTAYDLPREVFLRGLSEATELVFSGTEELPERISLVVHAARADRVLEEIQRLDPFLAFEGRWKENRVLFTRIANPTVGLSDAELIARYRRPQPAPDSIRSEHGAFTPGALISEGTRFPIPFNVEIVPDRALGKIYLICNGTILEEFPFKNPVEVDLRLFQAQTTSDRQKVVKEKLDQIHHEASRFPAATTSELWGAVARAASYLPHVASTAVVGDSLQVRMSDGSEMEWKPLAERERVYWSEPEAIQAAYSSQNRLNYDLSRGAVVFLSERFGYRSIDNGFEFFNRLDGIVAGGKRTLAEKEVEIRKAWREQADWVLEYFYTSLVDQVRGDSQTITAPISLPGATMGLGIPPNLQEFLKASSPVPLSVAPLAPPPVGAPPTPRISLPEPSPPPPDLPAPPPLEGVGLESLIDPKAEAAEDLFPTQP